MALITRTIRGIDTEVEIGPADGMPVDCAVTLDTLRTVARALLTRPIARLSEPRMEELCRALIEPSAADHAVRDGRET